MTFTALGINHKTAPVSLREKVAFTPDSMADALQALRALSGIREAVILSTCNRTELYIHHEGVAQSSLSQWLSTFHKVDSKNIETHLYTEQDEAALSHLIKVASGLDSLVLGEPQILGQVKQAYNVAKQNGAIHRHFDKLFQHVFSAAKKVRSETDIGANAVSVAFAAVQLAKHIFSKLNKLSVLLIGAGETIELVARHLQDAGVTQLTVANRTRERAQNLAEQLSANVITLAQMPEHFHQYDIVISSTASQLPLVGKGVVEDALKKRRNQPVFLVDLAVPRDIESQVNELDNAYLYTVDDLQQIVEANLASREEAAIEAQEIINQQVQSFIQWQNSHEQIDLVKTYREQCLHTQQQFLSRALNQLQEGRDAEEVVKELSHKLSNALMHAPTKLLKDSGLNSMAGVSDKLIAHFELDKSSPVKPDKD
ncbi:glutamyl-tRNA reductase [Alteromonas sediminis]|uniref:Glutamyl-tRNA reductase n=1 Tax=Alteromonas sediminis TaxID=2259342 RepID=A0A3N5Y358_9ALTE|nr:glutamyl-tRNA reductase [Alteromonas sediminis]RPJ67176.1 glutamyl-tRNA reductase [Alteromonas sediminis]